MSPLSFHAVHVQKSCFVMIMLLHFVPTLTATHRNGNETDRLVLLAIKEKITDGPQGVLSSWNASSHFCEWDGVICGRQHSRVIIIDVAFGGLAGTLSPYIGNLTFLRGFRLQNNTFQGEIPRELGRLFRLRELRLSNNSFEGEIPDTLSRCSELMYLDVGNNNLVGGIPKELSTLSKLTILAIHSNSLTGRIPSFVGNLTSLQSLSASNNHFDGQMSLSTLNLSFNNFEGEVPVKGVFTNASAMSVVGNSRICGEISELQLPKFTNKKIKYEMHLVYILIISAMSTLVGITLVSCLICCWLKKKRKAPSTGASVREGLLRVSYERLLKATSEFSLVNLLGVDSFGSVYKGILNQEGLIITVKVLNLQRCGASKSFMAECEALRNIRHRNLVKIITSCVSVDFQGNDFKALVYEFMPNGNLERWLHSSTKSNDRQNELSCLDLLQRINIAIDVASALDYLHNHCQMPIIQYDLKPSNILIDHDMVAHVGDFGLARFHPSITNTIQSSSNGISGTIGYAAPEYGIGSEISTKGDVYSYDICLLEMMTGKQPIDDMFQENLNLHNFARMAIPDNVIEIVDQVLLKNNEQESSATENNTRQSQSIVKKIEECLTSVVKIGVACSVESPQDRMNISDVVHELQSVRDKLLQH